jgi:hypothetical protein
MDSTRIQQYLSRIVHEFSDNTRGRQLTPEPCGDCSEMIQAIKIYSQTNSRSLKQILNLTNSLTYVLSMLQVHHGAVPCHLLEPVDMILPKSSPARTRKRVLYRGLVLEQLAHLEKLLRNLVRCGDV